MAELKRDTEVLVRVRVVKRAADNRPEEERDYLVMTSRGSTAYVEPGDIVSSQEP